MTEMDELKPAGVTEEQVEAAAKRIFEHWQFTKPIPAIPSDGVPAWVEGGNSLMQNKARAFARAALEAAAKAHPVQALRDEHDHRQRGLNP